ncbi:4-hydroxy-tetrahydrodipicolinate synthase [Cellulosimicrobium protaetiae]|uniref:4-hydroxy-tetrahydrodipicolinate synthase n=1 Tax=Cellulosimicrobium protaetiae TaxID=2587808 RepID=A0A6M5UD45_9MICO|nr:4-hydroxy-tetrahydrodipicolinate synthase [Cellulosimicrobium protaetiae]QJW35261.1 4-hydroxy-tetrahydrodipicolinate synthase [Cellulosimicrobium protaetiae]
MELSGLYVPLVTPFTDDDRLDPDALAALAAAVLDDGAAGVVALGTTGEPATLTLAEARQVVDVCAEVCAARDRHLVVGTGTSSTTASVDLIADLDPGAAAALVAVPAYTRPSQEGVVEHFRHLAAASPVPLVVYNVPYRTGLALTTDTLHRLADLPGVAGFKHTVGSIDDTTVAFLSALRSDVSVLAGDDLYIGPLIALGARGSITASANVAPCAYAELVSAWRHGPAEQARTMHDALVPLTRALFAEPNPAVIKAVLAAEGRIASPRVRLPLLPATAAALSAALACRDAPSAPLR